MSRSPEDCRAEEAADSAGADSKWQEFLGEGAPDSVSGIVDESAESIAARRESQKSNIYRILPMVGGQKI